METLSIALDPQEEKLQSEAGLFWEHLPSRPEDRCKYDATDADLRCGLEERGRHSVLQEREELAARGLIASDSQRGEIRGVRRLLLSFRKI
ncbi:hypothetical protein RND71_043772 [Anisodus tanguticus]|uniref:Uncharacterized protein n=1 Tax=Anisodus tanguticus TaxID=243964 RepID=A0AAE1QPN2_9SOLA|nr:hypothetical protein RND71_043772 [Anisodus tanguticus]